MGGLVAVAVFGSSALARGFDGGTAGEWLSGYTVARTTGLGGAFVAMSDEPFGAVWNPAGISRMFRNEVHLETATLFEDTAVHGVSVAIPARSLPSVGFTMLSLRSGDFEKTNELNEVVGDFREGDMAFLFTASKNVHSRVSIGTNLKVVRQAIDDFDGAGFGADVGVLVDVTPNLRVGTSLMNLGGPTIRLRETDESFPLEFRSGFAMRILSGRGLVSAEVDHRDGPGFAIRGGSEYWIHPTMALRVGYADDAPTGGMSYRVSPDMRFDYGVEDRVLGTTHRFGISYRFGGFYASSRANPSIFSPLGEQSVTKFELRSHTKNAAELWTLEIFDDSGRSVRRFHGRSEPPAHVMWDGKDGEGLALADGRYRYEFEVVDREGHTVASAPRTVEITTAGPRGAVPVFVD